MVCGLFGVVVVGVLSMWLLTNRKKILLFFFPVLLITLLGFFLFFLVKGVRYWGGLSDHSEGTNVLSVFLFFFCFVFFSLVVCSAKYSDQQDPLF